MTVTAAAALPAQLAAVSQELVEARERLAALCRTLDERGWLRRPASGGWSVGQIVTHINTTSEHYIPLIDDAIRKGRALGLRARAGRFRRGLVGWALLRMLEPPYRIKTSTSPSFEPAAGAAMADTLEQFDYLQQELLARVDMAAGLDLEKLAVTSPFSTRISYNLYVAFAVLAAHQRRHLWQAERTRQQRD